MKKKRYCFCCHESDSAKTKFNDGYRCIIDNLDLVITILPNVFPELAIYYFGIERVPGRFVPMQYDVCHNRCCLGEFCNNEISTPFGAHFFFTLQTRVKLETVSVPAIPQVTTSNRANMEAPSCAQFSSQKIMVFGYDPVKPVLGIECHISVTWSRWSEAHREDGQVGHMCGIWPPKNSRNTAFALLTECVYP